MLRFLLISVLSTLLASCGPSKNSTDSSGSESGPGQSLPGNATGEGSVTDAPNDPVIPPVDPVIPPVDPVIPPVDPVIPPVDPVIPPVDPVIPPVDPVIPPPESLAPGSSTASARFNEDIVGTWLEYSTSYQLDMEYSGFFMTDDFKVGVFSFSCIDSTCSEIELEDGPKIVTRAVIDGKFAETTSQEGYYVGFVLHEIGSDNGVLVLDTSTEAGLLLFMGSDVNALTNNPFKKLDTSSYGVVEPNEIIDSLLGDWSAIGLTNSGVEYMGVTFDEYSFTTISKGTCSDISCSTIEIDWSFTYLFNVVGVDVNGIIRLDWKEYSDLLKIGLDVVDSVYFAINADGGLDWFTDETGDTIGLTMVK